MDEEQQNEEHRADHQPQPSGQAESQDRLGDSAEEPAVKNEAEEIAAIVEAIFFSSDSPLPISKITTTAELPSQNITQAIAQLNTHYEKRGAAFRIEEIAGGFQMMTLPEYNEVLRRLLNVRKDSRLSQAAMETLAIIAYRQPILRADIEAIRGVAAGDILRSLLDKQLVKIVGRADVIGRPMLYGTTRKFLEIFGLANLDDLPRVEELRSGAKTAPAVESKSEEQAPLQDELQEDVFDEEDEEEPEEN